MTNPRGARTITNAESTWLDAMRSVPLDQVGTHPATEKLFGPDAEHIGQLLAQPRARRAPDPLTMALTTFHLLIGEIADLLGYSEDVDWVTARDFVFAIRRETGYDLRQIYCRLDFGRNPADYDAIDTSGWEAARQAILDAAPRQ